MSSVIQQSKNVCLAGISQNVKRIYLHAAERLRSNNFLNSVKRFTEIAKGHARFNTESSLKLSGYTIATCESWTKLFFLNEFHNTISLFSVYMYIKFSVMCSWLLKTIKYLLVNSVVISTPVGWLNGINWWWTETKVHKRLTAKKLSNCLWRSILQVSRGKQKSVLASMLSKL